MLIDTHTHIYLDKFHDDIDSVIQRCKDIGVQKLYMPNIDSESIKDVKNIAKRFPGYCIPMMGLHPCSVNADYMDELELIKLELFDNEYCAVGEIGVDLYWDKSTRDIQEKAFNIQMNWAKQLGLPIVIHSRDSLDLTISMVEEMNGLHGGIFHCFNGTVEQAERIKNIPGFFIGIGGVITFKNAGVDKIVAQLPLELMVLETDAPYLTPVPYRGKRNESSYVRIVAEKLAELHSTDLEHVLHITGKNAETIFPF